MGQIAEAFARIRAADPRTLSPADLITWAMDEIAKEENRRMAQQVEPDFNRFPLHDDRAATACRDTRVAEVDARHALDQFENFQVAARELRKTLTEQRNAVGDLLSRLDAAISLLPDYDVPRGAPQMGSGYGMTRGNL